MDQFDPWQVVPRQVFTPYSRLLISVAFVIWGSRCGVCRFQNNTINLQILSYLGGGGGDCFRREIINQSLSLNFIRLILDTWDYSGDRQTL